MERSERAHRLDQAIARTAPGRSPEPDFDTWRKEHAKALEALALRAQQRSQSRAGLAAAIEVGRRIMRSPISKLAVAAALIGGILLLASHLTGREAIAPEPQPKIVEDTHDPAPDQTETIAETKRTELALAKELFAKGHVAGLLSLLETGRPPTKLAVAEYLGQIGDASVLSALQRFAEQWQGAPGANPFRMAAEAIASRLQEEPPGTTELNAQRLSPAEAQRRWTFEPNGVLSGLVTDARTGKPVIGAEVVLVGNPYHDHTDEHGFYSIETIEHAGNYKIRVNSREYLGLGEWSELPVVALSKETKAVRHFELQHGCTVDVDVVDEQGEPVNDVHLVASWLAADRGRQTDLGSDKTDPNGRATVGAVEPSEVEYRITARHEDYAPEHVDLKLSDPNVISYARIVLREGTAVQALVTYADDMPAEGIRICAEPDWWLSGYVPRYYPVDAQGNLTLEHIVPGMYRIRAAVGNISSVVSQAELPLPEGMLLTVRIPEKSPQALVSIRGRIVWASEERPTSIDVSADSAAGVHKFVFLAGDLESFEIGSLEPGTYTLRFEGDGLKATTLENVPAPSDDLEIVLEYEGKPHLTGRVFAADSQDLVDRFQARVIKLKTLRGGNYIPSAEWKQFADGSFDIEAVGPGVYQVQVTAEGYAPTRSGEINTDDNGPVTVALTKGGRVEGLITDAAGDPVTGATVIPLSAACGNMSSDAEFFMTEQGAVTSADGRFAFDHLPAGGEALKVTHPGYADAVVREVAVVEGRTTRGVQIVLNRGARIEGCVYDAQGRPQANQTLFVQDDRGYTSGHTAQATRLGVAITDANGFYRVDRLPVGRVCYVMRKDRWNTLGIVQRACVPMEGRTVRLDLGGHTTISGVIHEDSLPLSNTRIRISNPDRAYSTVLECTGMTDAHARFTVLGVPAGRYGIHYERPGTRTEWVKAAAVTLGKDAVDLGVIDVQTTHVEVTLISSDPLADLSSWRVSLHEGSQFWGRRVGDVETPASPGRVSIVRGVMPGTYQVVASRDAVRVREYIVLDSTDEPLKVELEIPPATGTVSGLFMTDSDQPLIMWNSEKTVTAHLSPSGDSYAVSGLPAGHYTIGNYFLTDRAAIVDFEVQDGQARTVDIDVTDWSPDIGVLNLFVVAGDGTFLNHAEVWLEGPAGRLDPEASGSDGYGFMVPAGKYTLVVQCEGYPVHAEPVTLTRTSLHGPSRQPDYRIVRLGPR